MLSPLQIFWPDLWDRVFTPDYVPGEEPPVGGDEDVFYPTSEGDFEMIMAQMDQEEAEARRLALLSTGRSWTPEPPTGGPGGV